MTEELYQTTEKIFKCTSPKPKDRKDAPCLNGLNNYKLFVNKDPVRKDIINRIKSLNRKMTKAYLIQKDCNPHILNKKHEYNVDTNRQNQTQIIDNVSNIFTSLQRQPPKSRKHRVVEKYKQYANSVF